MFARFGLALLTLISFGCSENGDNERQQYVETKSKLEQSDNRREFKRGPVWGSFDRVSDGYAASSLGLGWDVLVADSGELRFKPTPSNDQKSWQLVSNAELIVNGEAVEAPIEAISQRPSGAAEIRRTTHSEIFTHLETGVSWHFELPRKVSQNGLTIQITGTGDHELSDGHVNVSIDGTYWFRWSEFKAWDSKGKNLPVEVSASGRTFSLNVDDTDAIYPITVDPLANTPFWQGNPPSDEGGMRLGWSVAAGDFTGNGHADILVGQQRFASDPNDTTQTREGRILIYEGSPAGPSNSASWTFESNTANALLGQSVTRLGRLNADGVEDFGAGASGLGSFGAIFLFTGAQTPALLQQLDGTGDGTIGITIAGNGDFNCDGIPDLLAGHSSYNGGTGRAWLYTGSPIGFVTPPQVFTGNGTENLGSGVAFVRSRGVSVPQCDDVIIASANSPTQFTLGGKLTWYPGGVLGLGTPQEFFSNGANQNLGRSVARAGDINADGFEDLVAGAPLTTNTASVEGAAYVYYGSATGLTGPDIVYGGTANGRFGNAVFRAGDTNGDGFGDIIVGSPPYSNGQTSEGRIVLFSGSPTGIITTSTWSFESDIASASFGHALAGDVDFNGDGLSDVVASGFGPSNNGMVRAFLGEASCIIGGAVVPAGSVDPNDPCQSCDPSVSGTSYSPATGLACDDGSACTENDVCTAGVCGGTTLSCDDGNSCTTDSCDTTTGCVNAAVADSTPCDDGLFCTENEVCTAGACGGGTPLDCSGSPGECFEAGVCNEAADQCDLPTPSPAGDACGGAVCQTAGTCDGAGTCQGAAPVDCSNLDTECTFGQCNATTGACEAVNVTNGTACDDGDACTNNDVCGGGVCGGSAVACDDGNPCTVESCDPVLGCVSVPAADGLACDDGNACTSADSCTAGVCGGSAVTCDDGNECTVDSCDAVLGCQAAPASAGTTCDDGLFCTVNNACDGAGACVGAPRDCSNAAATCFEGVACDEAADLCVPANPSASGTACGGDVCVDAGTCDGNGVCSGESNVDCSNLDTDCEIGVCDGTSGACVAQPRPDGTVCDDADACTENNICESGVCGGDAVVCEDDDNECTAPSCDPAQGCVFEDLPFGSTCSESFCSADGTSVSAGICDGSGACTEDTTTLTSCAPYVCGVSAEGAACLSSCEADVDCAEGFVCSNAECVEPGEDMGDMGTPDMGETDMGDDMGETDMGEPDMPIDDMGADMAGPDAGPQAQGQLEGSGLACASTDARPDHALLMLLVLGIGLRIRRR